MIWQDIGLLMPSIKSRVFGIAKGPAFAYDLNIQITFGHTTLLMFNVIDEFTRESLVIKVSRKLTRDDVIETLGDLFVARGVPTHVRSDNGPEFIATKLSLWFEQLELKPLFIQPGSPWENGYCESFNGKLRDEKMAQALQHRKTA